MNGVQEGSWISVDMNNKLAKVSLYKVACTQPREFCWMHNIKPLFNTLLFA